MSTSAANNNKDSQPRKKRKAQGKKVKKVKVILPGNSKRTPKRNFKINDKGLLEQRATPFLTNMCMPRRTFSLPRFIPSYHGSVYYSTTIPLDIQSGQDYVFIFRPEFLSCYKTLVRSNSTPRIDDPQHQNDYHNFQASNQKICYDADLVFNNQEIVKSSTIKLSNEGNYDYFHAGMKRGAKGYIGSFAFSALYMSIKSSDHANSQEFLVGVTSILSETFVSTAVTVNGTGTTVNVSVDTSSLDFSKGFIIWLEIVNPSTLGHVPSIYFGMQGYATGTRLAILQAPVVVTKGIPDLINTNSRLSVLSQFNSSSEYSVTAMDVLLKNTTAAVWAGGNVAIGNFPRESFSSLPLDYDGMYNAITSLRINKYQGNLKDGAHWFYVPQAVDNIAYRDTSLVPILTTNDNYTPFCVMTIQAPEAASGLTLTLEINMCMELITTDLSVTLVKGNPTLSFLQLWMGWLQYRNNCGENPSHLSRIKDHVTGFIKSPQFKTIAKELGPLLLDALAMM